MVSSRSRVLALAVAALVVMPVVSTASSPASATPPQTTVATLPAPAAPIPIPSPDRTGSGIPGWTVGTPRLTTPWTDQVSPTNALPEYPRPQLTRGQWRNLNGVWEFAAGTAGQSPPVGQTLGERVLVPYPIESALSGIQRHEDRMWYHRSFAVPTDWSIGAKSSVNTQKRLLLHFGAVDYQSVIYVNGQQVGTHTGGYDAFTVDVTDALNRDKQGRPVGEQQILIGVYAPVDGGDQPIGKQRLDPSGIFYTASSGIWQTVWMEPAAHAHIERLDMTPDLSNNTLRLTVQAPAAAGQTVQATAYKGTTQVATVSGRVGETVVIPVPNAKLWSPDHPFLYGLDVQLLDVAKSRHPTRLDEVGSYFGMRSISLGKINGKTRMLLNGKFTFQLGTLDQGFWPDGVYTAPTNAALRSDLVTQKNFGFNTVRKHIKVEPDRWYYDADKLGLLVWQDMPAMATGRTPTPAAQNEFISELHRMVELHKSFTSVIAWVDQNEGWGEFDPAGVADLVKSWDPSRLVDNMSGWNCCGYDGGNGDVIDNHTYVGPGNPTPTDARAAFDGEYGGLGLKVPGHDWSPNGFAYEMETSSQQLTDRYVQLANALIPCETLCGLSGSIYTQPYDVEDENNGLLTYDRQITKVDVARVRAVNLAVIAASDQVQNPPTPDPGTPGLTGVGYWPFDTINGTTTPDASGKGHDATLVNGPTGTTGRSGSALHFNGSNQYVDTGASILDTASDYTVSAWVKLDSAGGAFATAVSQDSAKGSSEFFLQYSGADGRFAFSSVGNRALASTAPQTGVWYHLVGVRDSVDQQLRLYVDGQLAGTTGYCPGAAATGHTVIGRGQFNDAMVDFWRGDLDQVHVYDRALSADEIQQLYASGQ
jgi:hypothetical protein